MRPRLVLAAILAIVLAGCATPSRSAPTETAGAGKPDRLSIIVQGGGDPRAFQLRCHPPGGTHPTPRLACAALDRLQTPFTPVPGGAQCQQRPAGPERATIRGTWQGERVELSVGRDDSCANDRWMSLLPLFVPRNAGL